MHIAMNDFNHLTQILTPLTREASVASLAVKAPTWFSFKSNQPISCLSMVAKAIDLILFVSASPATANVYPLKRKEKYLIGIVQPQDSKTL